MAPPVKIPRNLPELVRSAFAKAVASGDVNFYPTQATLLGIGGVSVRFFFLSPFRSVPIAIPIPIPLVCYAATLRCCDAVYVARAMRAMRAMLVMLLVGKRSRRTSYRS